MAWISSEHMADIHVIRQDVARARAASENHPEDAGLLIEHQYQLERRARAIRMIHRDDDTNERHLSAMFRCSKNVIREALAADTD